MKIAIVGSRRYENKKKIKDFIFKLKNEYGTDTVIVSGGCKDGADRYAKKYALDNLEEKMKEMEDVIQPRWGMFGDEYFNGIVNKIIPIHSPHYFETKISKHDRSNIYKCYKFARQSLIFGTIEKSLRLISSLNIP